MERVEGKKIARNFVRHDQTYGTRQASKTLFWDRPGNNRSLPGHFCLQRVLQVLPASFIWNTTGVSEGNNVTRGFLLPNSCPVICLGFCDSGRRL